MASHVALFPRLCLCSVQVFFLYVKGLPYLSFFHVRGFIDDVKSQPVGFVRLFHRKGRARLVLSFCGHLLRLHHCALLLKKKMLDTF